jgi:hypothetical protein
MKRKQSAQGLGFNSSNETSKELSKLLYKKQCKTNEISNVWREYESKDSQLKSKLSFVEFKKVYNRSGRKGIDRVLSKKNTTLVEIQTEFKPKINRVTKDGKIIEKV